MQRRARILCVCALTALAAGSAAQSQSLRGSSSSIGRQNLEAHRHQFTYLETRDDVRRFVEAGLLVPVAGNGDFTLKEVSFPYARPEVKVFLERLGGQYRRQCGESLVVTSLTRPRRHQPRNASPRSVHPTGMAFDLRRSWSRRCRGWLEGVLLSLEGKRLLEATYERYPPHYHVALFPGPYRGYLASLETAPDEHEFSVTRYRVARGDTLWKIAQRHRTTVDQVKAGNGLRSNRIYPGQILVLPAGE